MARGDAYKDRPEWAHELESEDDPHAGNEPWEQQPGEPDEPYVAFSIYRSASHRDRSCRYVADRFAESTLKTIMQWCTKYAWRRRVVLYHEFLNKQALAENNERILAMRRRQAMVALSMQEIGMKRLESFVKEGKVDPDQALAFLETSEDVRKWIDTSMRLERIALGDPAEIKTDLHIEVSSGKNDPRDILSGLLDGIRQRQGKGGVAEESDNNGSGSSDS